MIEYTEQKRAITSCVVYYGVATVSRIDKITGLFCRILSLLQGSFAKETYNFIDPTHQSHPIEEGHFIVCNVPETCAYIFNVLFVKM